MKLKRLAAVLCGAAMILPVAVFAGCGGGGADNEFTWFLTDIEDANYYSYYQENPAVQYLMSREYAGKDGEMRNISFEFMAPQGAASDQLNMLISTNSLPDVVDINVYSGSHAELYEDGYILVLGPYVEQYMPNYQAYIEAHPELEQYTYTNVGGEDMLLTLANFSQPSAMDRDWGWCYRRDWIVDYGKDPSTDAEFTGGFTKNKDGSDIAGVQRDNAGNYVSGGVDNQAYDPAVHDGDSWEDNVRFPSWYETSSLTIDGKTYSGGFREWYQTVDPEWYGNDPVTISDWEWMFGIFEDVLDKNNVVFPNEGYVLSLFYPGYIRNGDLVCSFGGGGPWTYIQTNEDDSREGVFGAGTETFRTYLRCMKAWYDEGWLDSGFADNGDMAFYQIDDTLVRQGHIGLWQGLQSTLGTRIYNENQPMTDGVVVFGARQPINDEYGSANEKYKIPFTMYADDPLGGALAVSTKAEGKDLALLFTFLDYLYGDEGSLITTFGLSKVQLDEAPQSVKDYYAHYGLSDGAYTTIEEGGETYYQLNPVIEQDGGGLGDAVRATRLCGVSRTDKQRYGYGENHIHSHDEWDFYPNTGFLGGLVLSGASSEDLTEWSRIETLVEQEYMYSEVPKFIKGVSSLERDWTAFVSGLYARGAQTLVDILDKYL